MGAKTAGRVYVAFALTYKLQLHMALLMSALGHPPEAGLRCFMSEVS